MDWRAPFNALIEIFPQVDDRIIKAVALEHANDIGSAVEFILNEVITNQNEKIVSSELENNNVGEDRIPGEGCCSFLSEQTTRISQDLRSHSEVIPNQNEKIVSHESDNSNVGADAIPGELCQPFLPLQTMPSPQESRFHSEAKDDTFEVYDEIVLKDLNAVINNCELLRSRLPANTFSDPENNIRQRNSPRAPTTLHLCRQLSDRSSGATSSLLHLSNHEQSKDDGITYTGLNGYVDASVDGKQHCSVENEDEHCCLDSREKLSTEFEGSDDGRLNSNCYLLACSPDGVLQGMNSRVSCTGEASTSQSPCTGSMNFITFEEENQNIDAALVKKRISSPSLSNHEETSELFDACDTSNKENMDCGPVFKGIDETTWVLSGCNGDTGLDMPLHSDCSSHIAEDSLLPGSNVSSSSQTVNTDMLEGLVTEAKKDKESLMEAMDTIRSLRIKADHEEIAARCAKDEALKGGADILDKVEELRQMIAQAKEANDMHAGEVYGEKAILATEARELRSRLAQLVADKEKAFCMIDKMRENLQARIDVAKREREAAEEEKMRKEESARKVLAMEEALMAKVARDARELELDAEANSKLREFLIDRGQIVDALQGEVAVLCEDVKLLKDQIDGGIPTVGNGLMNMQRTISARHQNMKDHYRRQSLNASFNQDASDMSEWHTTSDEMNFQHTTSDEMNFQSSSVKSYGRNSDNSMSGISLLRGEHGSEDTGSIHSGALYESVESMKMQASVASAGRLSAFIPDMDNPSCICYSDVERDFLDSRETFMIQTDMELEGRGLQSSIPSIEAKQQHGLNLDCDDDDEWQFLDNFSRQSRKSGSNSDCSGSTSKTKRS